MQELSFLVIRLFHLSSMEKNLLDQRSLRVYCSAKVVSSVMYKVAQTANG